VTQVVCVHHVLEAELCFYLGFVTLVNFGVFDIMVEKLNSHKCLNSVGKSTLHA